MSEILEKAKVVAISDLHGHLPNIEPTDFLLIAGDICPHFGRPVGGREDVFGQSQWLNGPFREWLDKIPAKEVVAVFGNHDWIGQKRPDMVPSSLRWHLLYDKSVTINGWKFYGSPYQLNFYDWAFNAPSGAEGEVFLNKKFSEIEEDTDIIIVHGPPLGFGDTTTDGSRTGSTSLLNNIHRVKPALSVSGHIHSGRGKWNVVRENMSDGIIANVSIVNEEYKMVHEPMVFELQHRKQK
jgi:Icc-related predicted phosphoesterase